MGVPSMLIGTDRFRDVCKAMAKIGGIPVVQAADDTWGKLVPIGIVTETDIFRLISEAWRADEASRTGSS